MLLHLDLAKPQKWHFSMCDNPTKVALIDNSQHMFKAINFDQLNFNNFSNFNLVIFKKSWFPTIMGNHKKSNFVVIRAVIRHSNQFSNFEVGSGKVVLAYGQLVFILYYRNRGFLGMELSNLV